MMLASGLLISWATAAASVPERGHAVGREELVLGRAFLGDVASDDHRSGARALAYATDRARVDAFVAAPAEPLDLDVRALPALQHSGERRSDCLSVVWLGEGGERVPEDVRLLHPRWGSIDELHGAVRVEAHHDVGHAVDERLPLAARGVARALRGRLGCERSLERDSVRQLPRHALDEGEPLRVGVDRARAPEDDDRADSRLADGGAERRDERRARVRSVEHARFFERGAGAPEAVHASCRDDPLEERQLAEEARQPARLDRAVGVARDQLVPFALVQDAGRRAARFAARRQPLLDRRADRLPAQHGVGDAPEDRDLRREQRAPPREVRAQQDLALELVQRAGRSRDVGGRHLGLRARQVRLDDSGHRARVELRRDDVVEAGGDERVRRREARHRDQRDVGLARGLADASHEIERALCGHCTDHHHLGRLAAEVAQRFDQIRSHPHRHAALLEGPLRDSMAARPLTDEQHAGVLLRLGHFAEIYTASAASNNDNAP